MATTTTRGEADRIDEHKHFKVLVLVDGTVCESDFVIVRGVGDLGYGGCVFVVNTRNQDVYPLANVLKLHP